MRRRLVVLVSLAVAVLVTGVVLWAFYNPDLSWDASIRDSDGDGYVDSEDPYPNDPTKWTSPSFTPSTTLTATVSPDGVELVFGSGAEVSWSDITVILSDGGNHESWENISGADLDDGGVDAQNYGDEYVGALRVSLTVTDEEGNGIVDEGDSLFLASDAFSDFTTYTVYVVHDPTAGEITRCEFFG